MCGVLSWKLDEKPQRLLTTGWVTRFGERLVAGIGYAPVETPGTLPVPTSLPSGRLRLAAFTGLVFALLQSLCTAVIAISGIRVAIGLTALAAAGGIYAPARGFHQDAIRIPMLMLGGLGAVVNLAVLARVWRLRARASAGWRRREITGKERRSERLQLALAVLTLVLIGAESWTHLMVHRSGPPPEQSHSG